MSSQEFYTAIDVGSSSIKVVIGEMRNSQLHVIGESSVRSEGLRKGIVVDIEEAVRSVKEAVAQAERMTGLQVTNAVVGISAQQADLQHVRGVVTVSNQEITDEDLQRVMQSAKEYKLAEGRELVNVVPMYFTVDTSKGITDPRGMLGVRLEVDATMITTSTTLLHNVLTCVERAGVEVRDIYFQPLVVGYTALTKDEKQQGTACIDIGGGSTTLTLYQDGILQKTAVIPLGGDTITQDIAIVLKTTTAQAEQIKQRYGHAFYEDAAENEFFEVAIEGTDTIAEYSERYLSEIIGARLAEIFDFVIDELARMNIQDVPGGIVLTGGVAAMEGIAPLARQVMQTRVRIYSPQFISVREPGYATAVGLIDYAHKQDTFFRRTFESSVTSSTQVEPDTTPMYQEQVSEEPEEKQDGKSKKMIKKFYDGIFE